MYRKAELYSLAWGGGLTASEFSFCGATHGGPLALTWRQDLHSRSGQTPSTPTIILFSAAGVKLSTVKLGGGHIIEFGWSQSEDLLCVLQDGSVSVYDMFGEYKRSFSMGQEAKEAGVVSSKIFESYKGTAVAVITTTNRVHVVTNINEPVCRKYSDIPAGDLKCWCVLSSERSVSLLISVGKLLCWSTAASTRAEVVQAPHVTEGVEEEATIAQCAVCSNQRSIALLSTSGRLWLGSSDLLTRYCMHDTGSTSAPRQIAWCGSGSVAVMWQVTLQLITITGAAVNFFIDSCAHLVQELDCVRLIGDSKHEILYKIPHVTVETLGIGSMSAGALLVEGHLGYEEDSARAHDCLAMIQGREEEAVHQCLEAARLELDTATAKILLKAALFGLTFISRLETDLFRNTANKLRLLWNLRTPQIGMPLTYPQLERLTIPVVLERLVARRLFPVALNIAKTLSLTAQTPRILAHWACYKINSTRDQSDDQLAQEIHSKLGYTVGVSYTHIANCADNFNRRSLAVKLLGYECRAQQQVMGLLKLGEQKVALTRALETGDTDLVLFALQHVKRSLPLADFLIMVSKSEALRGVFARSCRCSGTEAGREALRDLYVQEDDFRQQAWLYVQEAYEQRRRDGRAGILLPAADCFMRAKDEFSLQLTEEHIKLLKTQLALEEEHKKQYLDLSLSETVFQLIKDNHIKEAEKIKNEYKMPDKRYWYVLLRAHASASHWPALELLAKNKKPPVVGFEAFVDACLEFGNVSEAAKYVHKVREENKVEYLNKCGLTEEAKHFAESFNTPASTLARAAPMLQALFDNS